jgi:lipopolysaccharide transport system ATP-binding protein
MSEYAIKVEGLGKKYLLQHQTGGRRYVALRDVLADKVKSLFGNRKLEVVNRKSTEEFWALKDVSFEIKQGEAVGIIGRNGAGKSTLLKLLSRITEPTAGCIRLRGRVASLLEVGTGFHPELTGRENIFLNGAILGMGRMEIRRKFDEIVDFAEVERFLDTPVKRYSSGMYMRLAFAVAAHLDPEILVVDEVLAVGDAQFQKKCFGKMGEVSKLGRTILFVSHNMAAVQHLCNRGIILEKGQRKFDGEADLAVSEYVKSSKTEADVAWSRPPAQPIETMGFETIKVTLAGHQPHLKLICDLVLKGVCAGSPAFIAVDICDQSSTPIMQAIPVEQPFIPGNPSRHQVVVEIELPPLIPGSYTADFWVGNHYSHTMDYIRNQISFEVNEAPSAERSHPYSSGHGFMVPISRCRHTTC